MYDKSMTLATPSSAPFHIMTKPMGPLCNLDCKYCFYLEKARLFPNNERFKMSDDLLETYVRSYIEAQPGPNVSFAWQGGEPTLAGLRFFKKSVAFQKKYAGGKQIENAFQTNGTLLNDEFCQFFHTEGFLVGISIDGPEKLHDAYRVDREGEPTYRRVMRGIELCKKHKVEFNTLTVVNRLNAREPLAVYRHLRDIGSAFMQFIPLVERQADDASSINGLDLSHPPDFDLPPDRKSEPEVTDWSVLPRDLGDFFCRVFDRWVTRDVGKTYIQLFDATLGKWLGIPGGPCTMAETCGRGLALEHNGDLYACDHYVYPRYRLGNIMNEPIATMADSETMQAFGDDKRDKLTRMCQRCDYRFACNGDCPKHRFAWTDDGDYGLSYLCPAYLQFFKHTAPAMQIMAKLYQSGRSPTEIMKHSFK
ncbi:anaerobic sulfatase-maturation protein [Rubellicoccus peritrichatus]|uniref:Anaerobic sulfatase-maturation protein n=1 Tax=Rubellicoccus peritrichatus TaxID=3080537 RepID=A0AAQ3QQG5_9BACT|nr:anaerobic sulfatase-maturation protein [Puniceicoccus sp. CR14]WOO40223.1 anaerobic sulfatase-maturation protein [Puniceicoccus sp. CR14]